MFGVWLACTIIAIVLSNFVFVVLLVLNMLIVFMTAIERNTANGIIGIMGFILFSTASAMKLLAVH